VRQVVVAARDGRVRLATSARPVPGSAEVLVAPTRSVLSAGTERMVRSLASANALQKARARPDLVRDLLRKVRSEGTASALRAVRDGLDRDVPLGYSSAGVVEEVGAAVAGLRPGQRVAAAGAPHGELQVVSGLLAVPVPDSVTDAQAAFSALGAIALNGVRAGQVQAGSHVALVGMGLLGRIIARVAAASGASVLAVDTRAVALEGPDPVAGTVVDDGDAAADAVAAWSRGRGADVAIVAASDPSGRAVALAPSLVRDRATVVVVGDAALQLDRRTWYERSLRLEVVRSYGPGRYDPTYEDLGIDYPAGEVPWTAGRNLEAFLSLLAGGRLEVDALVGHEVPFDDAEHAYRLLEDDPHPTAVQLVYPTPHRSGGDFRPDQPQSAPRTTRGAAREAIGAPSIGLIGAGVFARRTLLSALEAAGWSAPVVAASRTGRTAAAVAGRVATVEEVLADDQVDVVAVATTHDAHAQLVVQALRSGKHVYCEKPLALDRDELHDVERALAEADRSLLVGFNRRWSQAVVAAAAHLAVPGGPLVLTYRVSTGVLPADHWYHDRRQGGRLIGEGCHFVDTAIALVGSPVVRVQAAGWSPADVEALLATELALVLEHDDGSLSTVTISSGGPPTTAKERIEVLGRGRSVVIDDFSTLTLDGARRRLVKADRKGHAAQLRAFRRSLQEGRPWPHQDEALHTTEVTLAAAEALLSGSPHDPGRSA